MTIAEILLVVTNVSWVVVFWKFLSVTERTFGSSRRSEDRERQDYFRLLEHLTEIGMVRPQDVPVIMDMHQRERVDAARASARMEVQANIPPVKPEPPPMIPSNDIPEIGATLI